MIAIDDRAKRARERAKAKAQQQAEPNGFVSKYDLNSKERFVDAHKSEFDRTLDELAKISGDIMKWDVEKFTQRHGGSDSEALKRKYEAFLGSFIMNAAVELYERGYGDVAIASLHNAEKVLDVRRNLEDTAATAAAGVSQDELFDLDSVLGLLDN